MPKRLRIPSVIASIVLGAWLASGCQLDKKEDEIETGSLEREWRSHLVRLDGRIDKDADSAFAVFRDMQAVDSLAADPALHPAGEEAVSVFSPDQLLDTLFRFPRDPRVRQAYSLPEAGSPDTLYRKAYGNGLFVEDRPCREAIVLSENFLHPARWIRSGLKPADIEANLGTASRKGEGFLLYRMPRSGRSPLLRTGARSPSSEGRGAYTSAQFYFKEDSLFAAVLERGSACGPERLAPPPKRVSRHQASDNLR